MKKVDSALYIKKDGKYLLLTSDKEELKDNERQFLDDLKDFISENGYCPTIREMCSYTGFTSTSSVLYYYRLLEKKGYIKRVNKRKIEILKD